MYTAQPHFAHYYEYTLAGALVQNYPLVDECYLLNQVDEEHLGSYQERCDLSPTLRPFSEFKDNNDEIEQVMFTLSNETNYEFDNLYEAIDIIPDTQNDFLILDEYLETQGFIEKSWGRGNWDKGPRFIQLEFEKNDLLCTIVKRYYNPNETGLMQVTESIVCQ